MGLAPHNNIRKLLIPKRIQPAIELLVEAWRYAEQTNCDPWEFAVEIELFRELGLSRNDFRWLVKQGLVEHQLETTCREQGWPCFHINREYVFFRANLLCLIRSRCIACCR